MAPIALRVHVILIHEANLRRIGDEAQGCLHVRAGANQLDGAAIEALIDEREGIGKLPGFQHFALSLVNNGRHGCVLVKVVDVNLVTTAIGARAEAWRIRTDEGVDLEHFGAMTTDEVLHLGRRQRRVLGCLLRRCHGLLGRVEGGDGAAGCCGQPIAAQHSQHGDKSR